MTRKRDTRRHDRGASDSNPDLDTMDPETDPDALVDSYFGPVERSSAGRARGRSRDNPRAIGPLRREIERSLTYALATAGDPRLHDLVIVDVAPAPDASCFQITVAASAPLTAEAHEALSASLQRARGELRAELARSLQRKRTPEVSFAIAASPPGGALGPGEDEP